MAASKEETAKIHAAMKVACHMLFTQAVNLTLEENATKRASYGSMQTAIDFLAQNGHPGVQPYQIAYHCDKKMNEPGDPSIPMQIQTMADTEVSPLSCEQHSDAVEGLLFLAGESTSSADMAGTITTNLTLKIGWPKGTTDAEICMEEEQMRECILAIVTRYENQKQEASKKKKNMKRGALKTLILEELDESIEISEETICTQGKQGQTGIIKHCGHNSPLEEI